MKRWEKVLAICLLIIALFIIFGYVAIYSIFNSYSSPFDRLSQRDFQNFANIGEQLFLLYDEGYITVGEIIDCYDYEERPEVKEALSKYKSKIVTVYFVDK
ncbi:hypothetical protein TEPIDINF_002647 [Tepidibacillus infernus]|uniref:hypothetical protein n=1 Tax=Tepidibacillus infernus TaxID=1806172 RepID=UPI003B71AA75